MENTLADKRRVGVATACSEFSAALSHR
jgi:hypothetical protein